jgi:penicillin-binding protein 2
MQLEDQTQNVNLRILTIKVIGLVLLTILGIRLYNLQIVKGEHYEEKARNQQIRHIVIPAPRGSIFDRNGKILVDSRPTYNVVIANETLKNADTDDRINAYADGLGLDYKYVFERISFLKKQPNFERMVLKESISPADIAWVEAHEMEYPELRVEIQPQRNYVHKTVMAHVLGYVGEISPAQLKKPEYQEKGFRPGDIIGKGGLEQYYDQYLRGIDGYREVVVDSRGRIQSEIKTVLPQPGQDLYTTLDLDLQLAAEEQLAKSATKRGTIISMDPNNGELLVMASAPSFDPTAFVNRSTTPEGRKEIADYYTNEERPLLNRAIQGRYPPGSTWKIPESLAGLQQGAITVQNSNVVCGGGITIGTKFTRCMGSHGSPPLSYAITKSCDGYYYRLALKMGIDGLIKMIEDFGFDKPSGVDLPNEKTPQTPKSWMPTIIKREGKWSDIRTVYASIGQDTVVVTPISMLRAVSSIGVKGRLYVPHLLKEFKQVEAVGDDPNSPDYRQPRFAFGFDRPEPKILPMTPEQEEVMVKGLWGVVNGGGTAGSIKINGFDIAGKTGTAQVAELGKDTGKNKDHAWFVSFAPAYKPEIAIIALIENSGFGGSNAAPAVKGVYEAYLQKKGFAFEGKEMAKKQMTNQPAD